MTHQDIDLLWWPSEKLNAAWHEYQEAQQWLASHKMTWAASTPLPENVASLVRYLNPRSRTTSPAKLLVAVTPMKDSIPWGKMTTPAKLLDAAMPTKTGARQSMDSGGQPAWSAQQETGVGEHEGGRSDIEEHNDKELSQGEDEMDEMLTPCAPTRHGTQVAIQDMLEHVLVAGKWASLGAVCKANEIHVKVSEFEPN